MSPTSASRTPWWDEMSGRRRPREDTRAARSFVLDIEAIHEGDLEKTGAIAYYRDQE